MATEKYVREIRTRLDENTYNSLKALANKRGESMSVISRRILSENLGTAIAIDATDVLTSAVRKAVAQEIRQVENRLASVSSKAAIAAASAEICILSIIQSTNGLSEARLREVQNVARAKGVQYLRLPLKQIIEAYPEEEGR